MSSSKGKKDHNTDDSSSAGDGSDFSYQPSGHDSDDLDQNPKGKPALDNDTHSEPSSSGEDEYENIVTDTQTKMTTRTMVQTSGTVICRGTAIHTCVYCLNKLKAHTPPPIQRGGGVASANSDVSILIQMPSKVDKTLKTTTAKKPAAANPAAAKPAAAKPAANPTAKTAAKPATAMHFPPLIPKGPTTGADGAYGQTPTTQTPWELAQATTIDENLMDKIKTKFQEADVVVNMTHSDLIMKNFKRLAASGHSELDTSSIDVFLEYWQLRTDRGSASNSRIWRASAHFWAALKNNNFSHDAVKKWWDKRHGSAMFGKNDMIIVPINESNTHWFLAVVNLTTMQTETYDSMGKPHPDVHARLNAWFQAEVKYHKNTVFKDVVLSAWDVGATKQLPRQNNCYDCGVFVCMYAANIMVGRNKFDFSQRDIPHIRMWMIQVLYKHGEKNSSCTHPGLCA